MVVQKNMAIILGFMILASAAFGYNIREHDSIQQRFSQAANEIARKNQRATQDLAKKNQAAVQALERANRVRSKEQLEGIESKLDILLRRR